MTIEHILQISTQKIVKRVFIFFSRVNSVFKGISPGPFCTKSMTGVQQFLLQNKLAAFKKQSKETRNILAGYLAAVQLWI